MVTKTSNIETIDYGLMITNYKFMTHTHRHKSIKHNILHNHEHNTQQTIYS